MSKSSKSKTAAKSSCPKIYAAAGGVDRGELSQRLKVAERDLACNDPHAPELQLIRRTIARDAIALTYGGRS